MQIESVVFLLCYLFSLYVYKYNFNSSLKLFPYTFLSDIMDACTCTSSEVHTLAGLFKRACNIYVLYILSCTIHVHVYEYACIMCVILWLNVSNTLTKFNLKYKRYKKFPSTIDT